MIQSLYHESRLDCRSWINRQTSSSVIDKFDKLKSNYDPCENSFSSITLLWSQNLRLSLSNLIGLLLSIKINRFHLDAYPTLTVDQLSPTSTTRAHWDYVYISIKLQQPHYEQSYHLKSKDHPYNYSIETITDDWVEIQVISRMVTLSTSYSLKLSTLVTQYLYTIDQRLLF